MEPIPVDGACEMEKVGVVVIVVAVGSWEGQIVRADGSMVVVDGTETDGFGVF